MRGSRSKLDHHAKRGPPGRNRNLVGCFLAWGEEEREKVVRVSVTLLVSIDVSHSDWHIGQAELPGCIGGRPKLVRHVLLGERVHRRTWQLLFVAVENYTFNCT